MPRIEFTVNAEPVGAPRMTRRDRWAKRPCVIRYFDWKDAVREAAGILPDSNSILRLSWVAYFEMPKSWSKKKRSQLNGKLHRSTPDRDNVDKAVLDALFKNDAGIASGHIEKRWADFSRLDVVIEFEEQQSTKAVS